MGVFNFKQIWVFFILIAAASFEVGGDDSVTKTRSSPPPSNNSEEKTQTQANFSPFKQPSIVVIVGVLTTIFSIALLLLLYAKHCKREISQNAVVYGNHAYAATTGTGCRKNSGIERGVIESLPIFRFSSLTGQKDGLECAVCLARFEATEVLRLLPKCKHAFHVECVDTWLDSHSTCPLCRHRVHPEDILLNDNLHPCPGPGSNPDSCLDTQESESGQQPNFMFNRRRVSGRHSSAGELTTSSNSHDPSSFRSRKSLDSARFRFSYKTTKKNESTTGTVAVACFDHRSPPRKDCLLLTGGLLADRESFERRFEHRIIISAGSEGGGFLHQRWSDVHPPDLLYLRSEMIISDSRRFSSSHSRPSWRRLQQHQQQQMLVVPLHNNNNNTEKGMDIDGGGRSIVIKSRSVSEITGLSRFPNNRESNCNSNTNSIIINRNSSRQRQRQRQAEAGLISRWLAWISSSHSQSQSQSELLPTVRANL